MVDRQRVDFKLVHLKWLLSSLHVGVNSFLGMFKRANKDLVLADSILLQLCRNSFLFSFFLLLPALLFRILYLVFGVGTCFSYQMQRIYLREKKREEKKKEKNVDLISLNVTDTFPCPLSHVLRSFPPFGCVFFYVIKASLTSRIDIGEAVLLSGHKRKT